MATRFLENLSRSSVAPAVVMQDFLAGCYGTTAESEQVKSNRRRHDITSLRPFIPSVVRLASQQPRETEH